MVEKQEVVHEKTSGENNTERKSRKGKRLKTSEREENLIGKGKGGEEKKNKKRMTTGRTSYNS